MMHTYHTQSFPAKIEVLATMIAAGDVHYYCKVTPEDPALPSKSFLIETTYPDCAAQIALERYQANLPEYATTND